MVLWITDRDIPDSITNYKIDFRSFASKEYHPFIATTKWEAVNIDITDNTPRGIIKQLVSLAVINPIYDVDNLTMKKVQLLCEIYPDEAAKILYYYKKGEYEELKKVLSGLKVGI